MQVQYHPHLTKRAARDYNQIKLDCYTVLEMVKRIHGWLFSKKINALVQVIVG